MALAPKGFAAACALPAAERTGRLRVITARLVRGRKALASVRVLVR